MSIYINIIENLSRTAQLCSFLHEEGSSLDGEPHTVRAFVRSLLSLMCERNKMWQYDRYLLGALSA